MALFKSDEEKKQEYLKRGLDFENKNENDKAVKEFQNILKLDPNDEDARFNLGFIYSDMKEYQKSYEHFKKLINNNPKYVEAFNNLGLLFARQGKYSDSIFVYDKGIEHNPTAAVLYNNKGNVLYDMGKYEDALKNFKRAGELDPVFNERLYHLGIDSFIKGGGIDDAIKKLEESAKSNINHAKTSHDLGVAYLDKHMYDKAITAFNRALAIDPNYLSAYINMGYAYQHKEDFINAIKCLERAIILNPKSAKLYNTMGLMYDKLEKPDIAVKAYKKAVALDPAYANSHYMLGQLYQNRGNSEKAVAEFTKHIRIHEHGALVDDAMQRIADLKGLTFDHVKELFAEYMTPETQAQQAAPAQIPHTQAEKREATDYMKAVKEKMAAAQAAAPAPAPIAPPSQVLNTSAKTESHDTKAMDANEYMKKLKEKMKQKQSGVQEPAALSPGVPVSVQVQIQPEPVHQVELPALEAVTIDHNSAIELPTFSEAPSGSSAFAIPDNIPVVNLDELPSPGNVPEEFLRATIIKPVGSDGPVPTDRMPEFAAPVDADPSANEAPKITRNGVQQDNPKPPTQDSGGGFKIQRNFY